MSKKYDVSNSAEAMKLIEEIFILQQAIIIADIYYPSEDNEDIRPFLDVAEHIDILIQTMDAKLETLLKIVRKE